jgi:hypothetical protein
MECGCWISVDEDTVFIRPCMEHDGLVGAERWIWLTACFAQAAELELLAVTR